MIASTERERRVTKFHIRLADFAFTTESVWNEHYDASLLSVFKLNLQQHSKRKAKFLPTFLANLAS